MSATKTTTETEKWENIKICLVLDANTFWVKEEIKESSESSQQFKVFEKELNRTFSEKSKSLTYPNTTVPENGEFVICKHQAKWLRGIVHGLCDSRSNYVPEEVNVFTVDFGDFKRIRVSNIFQVDHGAYQSVPYQAKKVVLSGIVPMTMDFFLSNDLTLREQKSKRWDSSAVKFVRNLVKATDTIHFECSSRSEDKYFGDLILKVTPEIQKLVSKFSKVTGDEARLSQILISCKFGAKDDGSARGNGGPNKKKYNKNVGRSKTPKNVDRRRNSTDVNQSKSNFKVPPSPSVPYGIKPFKSPMRQLGMFPVHHEGYHPNYGLLPVPIQFLRPNSFHDPDFSPFSEEDMRREFKQFSTPPKRTKNSKKFPKQRKTKQKQKMDDCISIDDSCSELDTSVDDSCSEISSRTGRSGSEINSANDDSDTEKTLSPGPSQINSPVVSPYQESNMSTPKCTSDAERGSMSLVSPNADQHDRSFKSSDFNSSMSDFSPNGPENLPKRLSKRNVLAAINKLEKKFPPTSQELPSPITNEKAEMNTEVNISTSEISPQKQSDSLKENSVELNSVSKSRESELTVSSKKYVTRSYKSPITRKPSDFSNASRQTPASLDRSASNLNSSNISYSSRDVSGGFRTLSKFFPVYNGGDIPLMDKQLISDLSNSRSRFNKELYNTLMKEMDFITRPQNYMWPAIIKGRSCLAVAGPRTGKTMGYAIPLISYLLTHLPRLKKRNLHHVSPSAIILCSGWKKVAQVTDYIRVYLPKNTLKIVSTWFGIGEEKEKELKTQLINGCDILVTTIPILQRLMQAENEIKCLSLIKCSHLVFDDLDLLWPRFSRCIFKLIQNWMDLTKKRSEPLEEQLILTSSKWFDDMDALHNLIDPLSPNIIISNPLEAVVGLRAPSFLYYVPHQKDCFNAMLEIVQDSPRKRIIIFTSERDLCGVIAEHLDSYSVISEIVCFDDLLPLLSRKIKELKQFQCSVLIVCDSPSNPLKDSDLRDVDLIIHFGVPSKQQLGSRYFHMIDHFPPDIGKAFHKGSSHLILWEENVLEHVYIVDVLKKLGASVTPEVEDLEIKGLEIAKRQLDSTPLCYYVKAFGECLIPDCKWRHHAIDKDVTLTLPHSGEVSFDIVSVIDASHYLVRLTSFTLNKGSKNLRKYYQVLFLELQLYFEVSSNKLVLNVVQNDALCGVNEDRAWCRGKILSVDYSQAQAEAQLFLIDTGKAVKRPLTQIFKLPDHFQLMPPLICEIYLCNLQPAEMDTHWTESAREYIKDYLYINKEKITYSGKVVFSMKESLWLSPLVGKKKVGKEFVNMESIRSILLKHKFAMINETHIKKLEKLLSAFITDKSDKSSNFKWLYDYDKACSLLEKVSNSNEDRTQSESVPGSTENKSRSTSTPYSIEKRAQSTITEGKPVRDDGNSPVESDYFASESESSVGVRKDEIEQEKLPLGKVVNVQVGQIINPLHFYVIKKSNQDSIKEMEDEIQEMAFGSISCEAVVNELCLVKLRDGRFYRGQVESIQGLFVVVLLIDRGEPMIVFRYQIFPCSASIAEALPKQSILCEIGGLSLSDQLLGPAADRLRSIVSASENIRVKATEVKTKDECVSFKVDIYDSSNNPDKIRTEIQKMELDMSRTDLDTNSVASSKQDDDDTSSQSDHTLNGEEVETGSKVNEEIEVLSLSKANVTMLQEYSNTATSENLRNQTVDSDVAKANAPIKLKHVTYDPPSNRFIRTVTPLPVGIRSSDKGVYESGDLPLREEVDSARIRRPQTMWSQDANKVYVKFLLPQVDAYKCSFEDDSIKFAAWKQDLYYIFDGVLFKNIVPSNCSFSYNGAEFSLTLSKKSEKTWPRLPWMTEKCPWIRPDLSNIELSSMSSLSQSGFGYRKRGSRASSLAQGLPAGIDDSEDNTMTMSSSENDSELFGFS